MANRVVLGEFDGDYVLRISRPGFNVLSTSLPRQNLAFDSRWPENMNIVTSATVTVSTGTTNFSHGMSYTNGPVALAWMQRNGYVYQVDNTGAGAPDSGVTRYTSMLVTQTQLRLQTTLSTATVHYLVLRNSNG